MTDDLFLFPFFFFFFNDRILPIVYYKNIFFVCVFWDKVPSRLTEGQNLWFTSANTSCKLSLEEQKETRVQDAQDISSYIDNCECNLCDVS